MKKFNKNIVKKYMTYFGQKKIQKKNKISQNLSKIITIFYKIIKMRLKNF